jgi:hypothetical protein
VRIIHHRRENILMHVFVKNLLGLSLMHLPERGPLSRISLLKEACGRNHIPWNRKYGCFKEEK